MLQKAHESIVQDLEQAGSQYSIATMRFGRLAAQDSRLVDGLQVADIAARIAAERYERFPDDRVEAARSVKQIFDRVLVNDHWI